MIPQLPSRNDFLKKSQFVWLQEKAAYDRSRTGVPSNLWYVDGAYYDLTNFINTHPGGSDFLKMTKGQDITELFYTHHLDLAKCQVILKKYFCSKADKQSQIFTFQEDGFYRTIQRKVETHFKHNDSGHSPLMHFITYLSIITFTFLLLLTGFFNSTVLAILTGFNLHILVGLGHSYLHQGSNQPFRYVFDFLLNSHYGWYVSHCISHHPFPNTLIDLEMSSLEPFMTYIRSRPKHSKFVWFYWHIFAGLIGLFEYILLLSGIVLNQEIFRPEYLIPILEYVILASVTSWGDGLILLLTMQFVASYLMIIVSFIVHRTTFQYSDGCQAQAEKDFGLYILQTTTDYDTQIKFPWNLILFESFNDHILHHLFPTVSISRIGELHPYLDETLKEFNLIKKYKNFGFFELSLAYIELINGQQYTPLK